MDNAQAQLEHQYNRIQNLELMLKYGPNTWRAQVRQCVGSATRQRAAAGSQAWWLLPCGVAAGICICMQQAAGKRIHHADHRFRAWRPYAITQPNRRLPLLLRPLLPPLPQTQLTEALQAQADADLASTRKAIDALNRERKLQQNSVGLQLRTLEDEWAGLVRKNMEIAAACDRVEEEVAELRARLAGEGGAANGAAAAGGAAGEAAAGGAGDAMEVEEAAGAASE